jgi:hypothetical protein
MIFPEGRLRAIITERCALSGEELRSFISDRDILPLKDQRPKAAAWEKLAEEIAFLCYVDQQGSAMAWKARRELQRGLDIVLNMLPAVIESADRLIQLDLSYGRDAGDWITQRTKLKHILGAILGLVPPPSDLPYDPELYNRPTVETRTWPDTRPAEKGRKGWHNYAMALALLFGEGMKTANPGKDHLPWGNASARFLEAIIPEISGEQPDRAAIAKYLHERAESDCRRFCQPDQPESCRLGKGESCPLRKLGSSNFANQEVATSRIGKSQLRKSGSS